MMAKLHKGLLACGEIMVSPYINGVKSNQWYSLGEATKFELTNGSEKKEILSGKCESYNQPVSTIYIPTPSELTIDFVTIDSENLALLRSSVATATTQNAGTFNDVVVAKFDRSHRVSVRNVDTLVVKDNTDATTYVEGTDYVIDNKALGLFSVLSTGTITDGQELHVSGTMKASSFDSINSNDTLGIYYQVALSGKNMDTNKPLVVDVFKTQLVANGSVNFLSNDFLTGTVNGSPVMDENQNSVNIQYEISDAV